jgi:hypothetical protein
MTMNVFLYCGVPALHRVGRVLSTLACGDRGWVSPNSDEGTVVPHLCAAVLTMK